MADGKKLIKIEDLFADKGLAIKQNDLNILLNNNPKPAWAKSHPFIRNYKYMPIERIEWLLTTIFQKWRVEILGVKQIANAVVVTVRLYVKDPITGDLMSQDGIGASPLQVKKGSKAIDWENIQSSAVQMSAPSAETYAIKDAAEKFGKIFGKDLNRKDIMSYEHLESKKFESNEEAILSFIADLEKIKTTDELKEFYDKNKGRGKDFDKLVVDKQANLINNQ